MKTPVLIAALLLGVAGAPAFGAETAAQLVAKGQAAEKDGDVAGARAAYTAAVAADPSDPNLRLRLSQLNEQAAKVAGRGRAKQLADIQIPQVDFDNVTLSDALDSLGVLTEKASGDKKFSPNFMIQDPTGKLGEQKLSLKVKGVPAKAVLEMVLSQTGAKARYDEHAVVITSASDKSAEK